MIFVSSRNLEQVRERDLLSDACRYLLVFHFLSCLHGFYFLIEMALLGGTAQNNAAGMNVQASMIGKPANSGPATNLNMGMDLWNSSSAAGAAKMRPAAASSAMVPGAMISDQWIQVRDLFSLVYVFYCSA